MKSRVVYVGTVTLTSEATALFDYWRTAPTGEKRVISRVSTGQLPTAVEISEQEAIYSLGFGEAEPVVQA